MSVNRGQNVEMDTHCKGVGPLVFSEMPTKHCSVIIYSFLQAGFYWTLIQKVPGCFKNLNPRSRGMFKGHRWSPGLYIAAGPLL